MHLLVELRHRRLKVNTCQCITHCFSTHTGDKRIFTVLILCLQILLLGKQLTFFERRFTRVNYQVVLIVDDAF